MDLECSDAGGFGFGTLAGARLKSTSRMSYLRTFDPVLPSLNLPAHFPPPAAIPARLAVRVPARPRMG